MQKTKISKKEELRMKIFKKAITIIIIVLLFIVIFASGTILVNSYIHPNEVPSFFGWKPFIVLSGSMESQIMTGDVAVVKEIDTKNLKVGDVIAFKDNDNIVTTHRIIEITEVDGETRYITKGDNNNTKDSGYVLQNQIEGIFKFRVGRLGNLALFIQTPIGMVVCISIPLIMLVLIQVVDSRKEKKLIEEKENKQKNMEKEMEELRKQNEELLKKN